MRAYNLLLLTLLLASQLIAASAKEDPCPDCARYANGVYLPDPQSCARYYMCRNGRSIRRRCGRGLYFDANSHICNFAALVNCYDGRDVQPQPFPIIETVSTTTCPPTTTTCPTTPCPTTTPNCPPTTTTCPTTPCPTTTPDCPPTTTTCATTPCPTTTPDCPPTTTTCPTTTTTCTTTKTTTTKPTTTKATTTKATTTKATTTKATTCPTTTTACPTTTEACPTTTEACPTTAKTTTVKTTTVKTTTVKITTVKTTTVKTTTVKTTTCPTTTCPPTTTTCATSTTLEVMRILRSLDDCATQNDGTFMLDEKHCRRYYVCRKGKARHQKCRVGQWFDYKQRTCRNRFEVTNCPAQRN